MVLIEKQEIEQKIKEDNIKAYEEWIQQKELKDSALKCLTLIPKPSIDYTDFIEDYDNTYAGTGLGGTSGGAGMMVRNSGTLRKSVGGLSIGEQTGTKSLRTSGGATVTSAIPPNMVHFNMNNLIEHHGDTLDHIVEIGKNLKKIDRTLFLDWSKWADQVIPNNIANIFWDFFPPIACDVHSSAFSQVS
jgi:hypothetical protein